MLCFRNSIYIYIYIYIYLTFDFFCISKSLVVPSVDHLNMNKTMNYGLLKL